MGCSSTTNNCCPEAPDITVNEYTVTVGGTGANFHQDVFAVGDSTSGLGLAFTLSHTPVQAAGVTCAKNGIVLRYTTDYSVLAAVATMASAISAGDTVVFEYLGTT